MATLTVTQTQPTPSSATTVLAFTNNLSAPVPLGNTNLAALVPAGAAPGMQWLVTAIAWPDADLSAVVAQLAGLGDNVFTVLFGIDPAEPFLTFKNLWYQGRNVPERLTGVLLALAYRTQALQNAGQ